jgi:hypothetical protein
MLWVFSRHAGLKVGILNNNTDIHRFYDVLVVPEIDRQHLTGLDL